MQDIEDDNEVVVEVNETSTPNEAAETRDNIVPVEADEKPEAKAAPAKSDESSKKGDDDDDLNEYGERVVKRINKEVWKRREAERKAEALEAQARELATRLQELEQRTVQSDDAAVSAKEAVLGAEYEKVQAAYKAAYDVGDTDEMFRATERLAELKSEQRQLMGMKEQLEERKKRPAQPAPEQPYRGPDKRALEWASANDWFGKDVAKTGAAYAIDAALKSEGFDPNSEEYYEELDNRLRKEFPALRGSDQPKPQPTSQPVAGVSRSPTSNRQVRLSASEVAMAQKLGVPLAEYARFKR